MKNSLWAINLILFFIFLSILVYIGLFFHNISEIPNLKIVPVKKQEIIPKVEIPSMQDIKFIEEKDIFRTVIPALIPETPKVKIPQPPSSKPVQQYVPPNIQFLEALPISITGIIPSSTESRSQVVILNNNTKTTESYKIGDKLFDAYVIRILPKKIILIRSNGQQETIFMETEDAKAEIKAIQEASWTDVISKQTENDYFIDPENFSHKVNNLAHLIEMLDATTAFQQEVSIGSRIGKMAHYSIGYSLGLLPGDIITDIAGIKPITTQQRVDIYNKIISLKLGDTITIVVVRKNQEVIINYTLNNFSSKDGISNKPLNLESKVAETKKQVGMDQQILTPTVQKIKQKDKELMDQFGRKDSVFKGLN